TSAEEAVLSVGNGSFAVGVDRTGTQTFAGPGSAETRIGVLAEWGWHSMPASPPEPWESLLRPYDSPRGRALYMDLPGGTEAPGPGPAWFRENPHKVSLLRFALVDPLTGRHPAPDEIERAEQHLALARGGPPGAPSVRHRPRRRPTGATPAAGGVRGVVPELAPRQVPPLPLPRGTCPAEPAESEGTRLSGPVVRERAAAFWAAHWDRVGMLDLSRTEDPRAHELERRAVLSLYLQRIHAAGVLPPAETGLLANSWRGKFHLEMHWWHAAHFALWGDPASLRRGLAFYTAALPVARETAARQGCRGARWPKQIGPDLREAPSDIGPFLLWQ